jgi:hypothetical protein
MLQWAIRVNPIVQLLGLLGCTTAATVATTYMVTSHEFEQGREGESQLEVQKKEAAAALEQMRRLTDLELRAEKASTAITNLAMEYLFRGDFSPIREALQAKAAASAGSMPAAAPAATAGGEPAAAPAATAGGVSAAAPTAQVLK